MQNKFKSRVISILLCLCVTLSCCAALNVTAHSESNKNNSVKHSFDFETASDIDYWEVTANEENRLIFEIQNNAVKTGTDVSNKTLALRAGLNDNSIFKLKDSIWNDAKQISHVSFDFYPQGPYSGSMSCLYWYKDENNWKGFEITYTKNEYWIIMRSEIEGYCNSTGGKLIQVTPSGATVGLDGYSSQFIKVDLDYTSAAVYLKITASDGKQSVDYRLDQTHTKVFYKPSDLENYVSEPEINLSQGKFAFGGGWYQTSYVDNFEIQFIDRGCEAALIDSFRSTYGDTLSLDASRITLESNKEQIENMFNAFKALPLAVRNYDVNLSALAELLNERIYELEIMKQNGITEYPIFYDGYPDLSVDFNDNSNLLIWKPEETAFNQRYGSSVKENIFEITQDPQNSDNNCLKISGRSGRYVLRDFMWPQKGTIQTINYKMRLDMPVRGQGQNNQYFYINYVDDKNYVYLNIFHNSSEFYTAWLITVKDGIESNIKTARVSFDLSQWFEVLCVVNSSTLIASVDIMPIDQTGDTASISTLLFTQNAKIAIGAPINNVNLTDTMWIDDLTVKFSQGDWDEDTVIKEPIVYHSGNTVYAPGDAVMLYGEELYSTVQYVDLMWIADESGSVPGYVVPTSYIDNGKDTSMYSTESNADSVFETADPAQIHRLQIVQGAQNSIKFIIPNTIKSGVFAVRLVAKYRPAPSSGRSSYNKTVYLNVPEITQINCDEGSFATPGGSIRITGRNLAPEISTADQLITDADLISAMNLKMVLKTVNGKITPLVIDKVYSPYSVEARVPEGIAFGNYEISYYNGHGGSTCWSVPVSVKIDRPVRSTWKTDVFNVCDFGAVSNDSYNDTFAFVNALDAAAKNGGGTVYVPAGIYHLVNMIVVPENVRFKGDGKEVSIIYWSPYLWDFGELPKASVCCSSNTEISDMSLYAARSGHMICVADPADSGCETKGSDPRYAANVYIHNVKINASPAGNGVTGGGAYGINISGLTMEALEALIYQESGSKSRGIQLGYCENAQISDNEIYVASVPIRPNFQKYSVIKDNYCELITSGGYRNNYWMDIEGSEIIFEKNNLKNCIILFGNRQFDGVYFAQNKMSTDFWNNTELITGDQTWHWGAERNGIVQKHENDVSGCTYLLSSERSSFSDDRFKGEFLCIRDGQGSGQVRRIVHSYGKYVVLESPFIVEPNRNSRASIEAGIANVFFTANDLQYGTGIGSFGDITGTVMSYNRLRNCEWLQLWPYSDSCDWYVTISDNLLTQGYHHLATGETDGDSGYSQISLRGCGKAGSIRGVTIKNNELYEGWYISISSLPYSNSVTDVLIDNNYINGANIAVDFATTNVQNGYDGIMLYRNTCEECITDLGGNYNACSQTKNNQGFAKVMVFGTYNQTDAGFVIGDVNMDGKVTLKDSTFIRYYLIGKTKLSEEQVKRADVNLSGKVTILDSTLIKMLLCGKVTALGDAVSDINLSESSSEASSSSSSSQTSSGSSSASSTSSSSTSSGSSSSGTYDTSSVEDSGGWLGPY